MDITMVPARPRRLLSLDALRGSVVLAMVFVNYISGMEGLPWWVEHAGGGRDLFSIADLVLPAFLFMVGVAIPFSLGARMESGAGWQGLLARILPRSVALVFLGVVSVNGSRYSPELVGIPYTAWSAMFFIAAILAMAKRPEAAFWRRVHTVVRYAALALISVLVIVWRPEPDSAGGYVVTRWWGILGIIGWTYLVAAAVYVLVRGDGTALMGALALFMCVYIGTRHGRLGCLSGLNQVWSVSEFLGSMSGIAVAGAVAGSRIRSGRPGAWWFLLWYGLGLLAAGWLLRPLHGFHKNATTESFSLVAAGVTCLAMLVFHLMLDRKSGEEKAWFAPQWLILVGRNALLAFLLPSVILRLVAIFNLPGIPYWSHGGVVGAAAVGVYSVMVLSIAAIATKAGFIVKL